LIKNIESIQNMAMCHEISVGKTGCLTKSRMTVGKYQITTQTDPTDHIQDETYANSFSTRLEV
jgi:cation transport ATPase